MAGATKTTSYSSSSSSSVSIVQEMGFSETSVMSQNAVTEAINAVEENIAEVTQYMGQSTEKVMSQKAVTNELKKLSDNMAEVVQETGDSNLTVMSQRATTNAIDGVDKVLTFDGFIEEAEISLQVNPYDGGKIYFVKSANRFAYYREEDGIYTAMWNGFTRYATFIPQQGVIPNSDRIFIYNNELYLWDGETLVKVGESKEEIPEFSGIVDSARVLNSTGFNRNGEVYFIKNPRIDDNIIVENGIFAYKVRDAYYRSWSKVYDYMNNDLSQPINNKLFGYNKQQYVYLDGEFSLLSNIGKLKWNEF
jgi:hypothetical protein